jgi:hypothetical protein
MLDILIVSFVLLKDSGIALFSGTETIAGVLQLLTSMQILEAIK